MSGVRVTVYGGAGQIGGNKILLEDGEAQLFFDFGLNFEDSGKYFAEFLSPRTSTSGTYDHLMMGLLPPGQSFPDRRFGRGAGLVGVAQRAAGCRLP